MLLFMVYSLVIFGTQTANCSIVKLVWQKMDNQNYSIRYCNYSTIIISVGSHNMLEKCLYIA
jgi:hypothetical protein